MQEHLPNTWTQLIEQIKAAIGARDRKHAAELLGIREEKWSRWQKVGIRPPWDAHYAGILAANSRGKIKRSWLLAAFQHVEAGMEKRKSTGRGRR